MPDIFVPNDTLGFSNYLMEVNRKQALLYEYTFEFMDAHRAQMRNLKDYKQVLDYLKPYDLVNDMADYAVRHGVKRNERDIRTSRRVMDNTIKAFIGRHVLDDEGFFPIFYLEDTTVERALEASFLE